MYDFVTPHFIMRSPRPIAPFAFKEGQCITLEPDESLTFLEFPPKSEYDTIYDQGWQEPLIKRA